MFRGTMVCFECGYADAVPAACEYKCITYRAVTGLVQTVCPHRDRCPCGWSVPSVQRQVYERYLGEAGG